MSALRRLPVVFAAFALAAGSLALSPRPVAASWERTLSVSFAAGENAGEGAGRVTSDDGGIDCSYANYGTSGDCSEHYVFPNFSTSYDVTLTFDPVTGSVACTNVYSGCGAKSATVSLPIHFDLGSGGDVAVQGSFSLAWVYVQVDEQGPGTVSSNTSVPCTPSGGAEHCWLYKYGNSVSLTAHPDSGYPFSYWLGSPCETTATHDTTCTFSADDSQITGVFGLAALTIRRTTGGSICEADKTLCLQPGQTALRTYRMVGTQQTFDAVPDSGYVFDHWNAGPCSGKAARCTFTLSGTTELTATFKRPATPAPSVKPTAAPTVKPTAAPSVTARPTATPVAGTTSPPATLAPPASAPASPYPDGTAHDIPSFEPAGTPAATDAPAAPSSGSPSAAPVVDGSASGSSPDLTIPLLLLLAAALVVLGVGFTLGRRGPAAPDTREG